MVENEDHFDPRQLLMGYTLLFCALGIMMTGVVAGLVKIGILADSRENYSSRLYISQSAARKIGEKHLSAKKSDKNLFAQAEYAGKIDPKSLEQVLAREPLERCEFLDLSAENISTASPGDYGIPDSSSLRGINECFNEKHKLKVPYGNRVIAWRPYFANGKTCGFGLLLPKGEK